MSLSASTPGAETDPFGGFKRHALFALLAFGAMWGARAVPAAWWRRLAWPLLLAALVLQVLVYTPLGYESGGNRNWLRVGAFTAQPSEVVKFALTVWAATVLTAKHRRLRRWKHAIIPVVPIAVASMGINLIGGDLGTVFVMAALLLGTLLSAGIQFRTIALTAAGGAVAALIMTAIRPNRVMRVLHYVNVDCHTDTASYYDLCWQPLHGEWALARGGLAGVGLGNSTAKWGWLPEADSDYVFAIIGEELGLIGSLLTLGLFLLVALGLHRVIRAEAGLFGQIAIGGVASWLLSQVAINIAVVLGFLPVLGVPLPFLSAGGTALLAAGAAIGLVLSIERTHPGPILRESRHNADPRAAGTTACRDSRGGAA